MSYSLPLEQMTTSDKLRALEELWDNLRRNPEDVPSPDWHDDVLRSREAAVKEDASAFRSWTDAKREIRERAK